MAHDPATVLAGLASVPGGSAVLELLEAEPGAWLVGGAVRDGLLGRAPRELDVVLDTTRGARLASAAARLGTLVDGHERFGTATVATPDGGRVDLATARREVYPRPGALPEVEPAGLEEDLPRRDVTVNAIALRPREGDEAEVRAHPEALADLDAGRLRVLHPASFLDDPTRLWRVARYAARLDFAPEPGTAALAVQADPTTAAGPRHGRELELMLGEADPRAALTAAQALAPQLLPDGFRPDAPGADEALALLPAGEGDPGAVLLASMVGGVDAATLVRWLDDLGMPALRRDVVAAGSRPSTLAPLRAARTPAEIGRAARGAPVELVALAGGEGARRWLEELRHVRLDIDGSDLLAAGIQPGPELGARLARALDAKLDGDAPAREEQLAVALGEPVEAGR